jgi:hypothetical protein
MRIVRPASEAEVIAVFLRAELDSERWRDRLLELLRGDGAAVSVVATPNLHDERESAYRASLLDRHRGWLRREGLFHGFPNDVEWTRVALTPDEVVAIRYINWDWWLRVSGGTRRPLDTARRIRAGEVPGADLASDEAIAARLRSADPPPELIAVAMPGESQLVAVEGHVRLTAYALFPHYLPDELEILLGTAPAMDRWSLF